MNPTDDGATTSSSVFRAMALVVVAAAVVVLLLYHLGSGKGIASTPTTTTSTTTVKTPVKHKIPPVKAPSEVTVQVLNGLQTGSLAGNLTTKLKADGYQTLVGNNTTAETSSTEILVSQQGYLREAKVLAAKLHLPTSVVQAYPVSATAPVPQGVTSEADVIVIIGSSLQAQASSA